MANKCQFYFRTCSFIILCGIIFLSFVLYFFIYWFRKKTVISLNNLYNCIDIYENFQQFCDFIIYPQLADCKNTNWGPIKIFFIL